MDTKNQKDITFFAKTNFRNKQVPFGIKREDRRKHMYVIGKTGMGKTTLMENMVIQDIINGEGLAFVDPHGDSVEKILNFIPNNRVNDVVYINPADMDFPIAFNILESVDPRYKHLVASGLMGVFTKIWAGVWSPRMEYILNNCILALLDSPGNTLLGITRMLIDKKYRKKIIDNVKDPMVRSFWIDEYANWNEKYRQEAVAPIQNKVGQFLSTGLIRNIVGQSTSTVDLRQLMDEKKIILLNLSKGRIGEDNSALLGAMIITKLQLAALSRVDIPEEERADFYLYVDEFQNFATDSFATILSEARKYRLNLIIGHQYIGQLVQDKNTKVRDAVFGNVGSIVSFRVGAADAEYLEKEFAPQFTETDLVNIPKHTILLRLMINGVASDPFTAETLPPGTYQQTENAQKIIRVSRERYANPVEVVEQKISKWMGQDFHEQIAVIASGSTAPEIETETIVTQVPAPLTTPEEQLIQSAEEQLLSAPVKEELEDMPLAMASFAPIAQAVPEPYIPQKKQEQPAEKHKEPKHPADHPKERRNPESHGRRKEDHKHSKEHKDKKHKKGPDNAIWSQVANINSEKQKQNKEKQDEIVKMLKKEKVDMETKGTDHSMENLVEKTILKPGETIRFDE